MQSLWKFFVEQCGPPLFRPRPATNSFAQDTGRRHAGHAVNLRPGLSCGCSNGLPSRRNQQNEHVLSPVRLLRCTPLRQVQSVLLVRQTWRLVPFCTSRGISTYSFLPPPKSKWSPSNQLPSQLGFAQSQHRTSRKKNVKAVQQNQKLVLSKEAPKGRKVQATRPAARAVP